MSRQANTVGGGAQTNVNGLHFEQTSDLRDVLEQFFTIIGDDIYSGSERIATLYKKNSLYKNFLEPHRVDYSRIQSRKLLPDDALFVYKANTLYIIEKKFQSGGGSVDEKLQTCDFKKKQYQKLVQSIGCNVEYCYFLNDWFLQDSYRDVKEYIESVGCRYFFDGIPLEYLNLK